MSSRGSVATKTTLLILLMFLICLVIIVLVPVGSGKTTFTIFDKKNTGDTSSNNSGSSNASEYTADIYESEKDRPFKVLSVIDGDTIKINYYGKEELVRLIGVNTPEVDGPYTDAECFGNEASAISKDYLENQWVIIRGDATQGNRDKYDRLLRYVSLAGTDFGGFLIERGYAYEYTYETAYDRRGVYLLLQQDAENNNRGLWAAGVCDASDEEEEVMVEEDTDTSTDEIIIVPDNSNNTTEEACLNIKGNISLYTGERIYHLPWQKYYNNTVISPEYGERYFCTEEEAINAGWRRSKE